MVIELARRLRQKFWAGEDGTSSSNERNAEIAVQSDVVAEDFDPVFYALRYPEAKGDLLEHYMTVGWRLGNDPTPWFSTKLYLATYEDVAIAGLNPFYHYIQHGKGEGRSIAPAEPQQNDRSWEIEAIRGAIDQTYYAEQLRRIDVEVSGVDFALHYWREGANSGLDPTKNFSTSRYLDVNADVAAHGVNPFAHYLAEGRKEGRSFGSPETYTTLTEEPEQTSGKRSLKNYDRDLAEKSFDAAYYLAANPDVAAAGVDPLDHFLASGWREGRNPNLAFSVNHYLDFYPDVKAAGINPFLHYLMTGKSEGRLPRHDLGFRYDIITSLQPLEARIEHARKSAPRRKLSDSKDLRKALSSARRFATRGLYVSASHDDFTENFGGVQLVLMRESAAVDAMGFDHLHLFPAAPLPVVELETSDPLIGVLLNGKRVGFFRASDIERELAAVAPLLKCCPYAIHSLIGHNAEALVSILKAAGCGSGWYWVHDYSSACTGYTLLRNDVEYCGGPSPSSTACSICVYGNRRIAQMKAHELIFKELDLTVVAPSNAALDVWKTSTLITAPARVHEHLRISVPPTKRGASSTLPAERPLRIAYIGQPVPHKGWPVFRELTIQFGMDPRYQFYHVGKDPQGVPATFKEVAVGPDDLDKMVCALRELEIDVAIIWSIWPETFCIAAVEAMRAGASVITFKDSGNVAAIVKKLGFGTVLDSEMELASLFESGEVTKLVATTRPVGLHAAFSNMTADLIGEKDA